jgi:hypothetical protein
MRDGRLTETVLSQWFYKLDPKSREYLYLDGKLWSLAARYGKRIRKAHGIHVPRGWLL